MKALKSKRSRPRTLLRRLVTSAVLVASLLFVLYGGRSLLQSLLVELLVHDDLQEWKAGPYLVVLMGDLTSSRAHAAYELWKLDPEQTIVLMEENKFGFIKQGLMPPPSEVHKAYFLKSGVPPANLRVIDNCGVDSTLDEARCFFGFLSKQGPLPERVTLVTSFYHSARAYWIFSHIFHKIGKTKTQLAMVAAPALASIDGKDTDSAASKPKTVPLEQWWQREDLFIAVFNEYLKWTYWKIKGLPPTIEKSLDSITSRPSERQTL